MITTATTVSIVSSTYQGMEINGDEDFHLRRVHGLITSPGHTTAYMGSVVRHRHTVGHLGPVVAAAVQQHQQHQQ
jgi:hypothetical protein